MAQQRLIHSVNASFSFSKMTEENWSEEQAHTSQVADITEIPEIKLFGKWSADDVQIGDISLQVSCFCFVT